LVGGAESLVRELNVPPAAVKLWLGRSAPVPGDIFLKLVDLLLDRSMMELQPKSKSRAAG
jgi:hypothetical protein